MECVVVNLTLVYALLAYSNIKQKDFNNVYVSVWIICLTCDQASREESVYYVLCLHYTDCCHNFQISTVNVLIKASIKKNTSKIKMETIISYTCRTSTIRKLKSGSF